jgi:hypothetical protein
MPKQIVLGVGEEFLRKEGMIEKVEPWEDGFRTRPDRGEFEWWYFDAHLKDGTTLVIVFLTKSILNPKAPFEPQVTITVTRPVGEKIFRVVKTTPEHFSSARDRCDVHIATCHIHGDLKKYNLHVEAPAEGHESEIKIDLDFVGSVDAWRPGAGKNYYGKGMKSYFAWLAAIPFGNVRGKVLYKGKEKSVSGDGYHDHNWGNVALPTVLSHWVWGRASVEGFNLIFVEMVSRRVYGSKKLPVFFLTKGRKLLVEDGRPLQLRQSNFIRHNSGRRYPQELNFQWQNEEGKIFLKLSEPEVIEATSLLTMLPGWQQKLARLFANPYYFRFSSRLDLEVELGKIQTKVTGKALYELMFLH